MSLRRRHLSKGLREVRGRCWQHLRKGQRGHGRTRRRGDDQGLLPEEYCGETWI